MPTLVESLVHDFFDITVCQELEVDHGLTVPLSVYCPEPGDAWPCPVIPILVNVIQYPQPTGECWCGRTYRSDEPEDMWSWLDAHQHASNEKGPD
jgi:hypothetical protein